MKKTLIVAATHAVIFSLSLSAFSQDSKKKEIVNEKCPITGKAVNPKCTTGYEGKTYAFCSGKCRKEWIAARKASLYDQIGGEASMSAAVELFYKKVLADDRVNYFFDDINMKVQKRKQQAFLSAALGGPTPWEGKDLRKAHSDMDLTEVHFNAIAEHLQATLEELKVKKELIDQIMAIVASTKKDVLNQ